VGLAEVSLGGVMDCKSCVFFEREGNTNAGWCHRYPPVLPSNYDGTGRQIPLVRLDDWCGEYKLDLERPA
jgi:hypothetical protein